MTGPRIFISHSSKDAGWCSEFAEALKGAGADVWYDQQGLYVGDQWIAVLEKEIQSREVFLFVLTLDSWASEWVQKEFRLALGLHKRILGVIHKPVQVSGFITTYQLLDVVGQGAKQTASKVAQALGIPVKPMKRAAPGRSSRIYSPPSRTGISGFWSGTSDSPLPTYECRVHIEQQGDRLVGTGTGDGLKTEGKLEGTIRGDKVTFTVDGFRFSLTVIDVLRMHADGTAWDTLPPTWLYGPMKGTARSILPSKSLSASDRDEFEVTFRRPPIIRNPMIVDAD